MKDSKVPLFDNQTKMKKRLFSQVRGDYGVIADLFDAPSRVRKELINQSVKEGKHFKYRITVRQNAPYSK